MIIYKNCRIIDGRGNPPIEKGALAVEGSRIAYVGKEEDLPECADAQTHDMEGSTLLPGLFNTHVHLALRFPFNSYKVDEYNGPAYRAMVMYRRVAEALCMGITTIRCVGEADDADLAIKKAINKKMIMGSRVITAGEVIIAHGGHGAGGWGSVACSGEDEFRKATRNMLFKGVDLIKICITGGMVGEHEGASDMQMSESEIRTVVEVARNAGKIVAGHIGHDEGIRAALRCGVKSIEHGYILNEQTAAMMKEADVFYVPTLAVSNAVSYLEAHKNPEYHIEKIREVGKKHKNSAENAIKAGVTLAVGTDLLPSDPLDGTNATVREIELLTEAGMTNLEAIKAGTYNSARLCGLEEITGSLCVGLEADIIAVKGKPDQNISDLRHLTLVLKGGSLVLCRQGAKEQKGFSLLPFGETPEGASFINW